MQPHNYTVHGTHPRPCALRMCGIHAWLILCLRAAEVRTPLCTNLSVVTGGMPFIHNYRGYRQIAVMLCIIMF